MWHEKTVTHLFTPTKLGEILAARTFTAFSDVNPLSTRPKKSALNLVDGIFESSYDEAWSPATQWGLVDGFEAMRWAWVFCEFDTEQIIGTYIDFFTRLLRTNTARLPQVKLLWEHNAWIIALGMRSAEPFGSITARLMIDVASQQEILNRSPRTKGGGKGDDSVSTPEKRSRPSRPARAAARDQPVKSAAVRDRSRSSNKGKGRGKTPGRDTSNVPKQICNRFQTGACTSTNCRFEHKCATCNKPGHGSASCWWNAENEPTEPAVAVTTPANKPNKGGGKTRKGK
jgi:hypothetical protein